MVNGCLTSETVKGLALTLKGVDNVHGSDSLTTGVFSVGDGVANDVFEKHLEDTASLFVNQTRDTFDTASSSKSGRSGFLL